MNSKKSFFEVFENELDEPGLIIGMCYVSYHQIEAVRLHGGFFDLVPTKHYEEVAKSLVHILRMYNSADDNEWGEIITNNSMRESDIKITERFLKLFQTRMEQEITIVPYSIDEAVRDEWSNNVTQLYELATYFHEKISDEKKFTTQNE